MQIYSSIDNDPIVSETKYNNNNNNKKMARKRIVLL